MHRLSSALLILLVAFPGNAWRPTLTSGSATAAAGGGAAPTIRGIGAPSSATAAVTPAVPAGTASGDLLIMFCKTQDQAIDTNDAAWTESASSPNSNGDRLTVFWLISDGSDDTLTTDSGLENTCVIFGVQAGTFNAGTPFNITGQDDDANGTAVSIASITTTVDNTLCVGASARADPDADTSTEFSSLTNAALTNLTEQLDRSWLTSNGGAMLVYSGEKAAAGAIGNTTATAVTTAVGANINMCVAPD
jgi:hypothetical protein